MYLIINTKTAFQVEDGLMLKFCSAQLYDPIAPDSIKYSTELSATLGVRASTFAKAMVDKQILRIQ